MSDPEGRRERLEAAQRRLARAIADPATRATMIPQISGQIVAIERRLDQLLGRRRVEDALPVAEELCLLDLLGFAHWLRGQIPARRSHAPNEYVEARNEIFESWRSAGFELSSRSGSVDEWVEENRIRLVECLEREA